MGLFFGHFVQDQFAPHPGHLQLGELDDYIGIPDLAPKSALGYPSEKLRPVDQRDELDEDQTIGCAVGLTLLMHRIDN